MSPDEAREELRGMVAIAGALTCILAPATGVIMARAFHRPAWYGLVGGGWVLWALLHVTLRRRAKAMADYLHARNIEAQTTKELAEVVTDMHALRARMTGVVDQ